MGIMGLVGGVADRLGLIRVVEVKDPAKPQKVTTRSITLKELVTEVRAEQVKALSELPAELSVDFAKVFEAAGVKIPAGPLWKKAKKAATPRTARLKEGPHTSGNGAETAGNVGDTLLRSAELRVCLAPESAHPTCHAQSMKHLAVRSNGVGPLVADCAELRHVANGAA